MGLRFANPLFYRGNVAAEFLAVIRRKRDAFCLEVVRRHFGDRQSNELSVVLDLTLGPQFLKHLGHLRAPHAKVSAQIVLGHWLGSHHRRWRLFSRWAAFRSARVALPQFMLEIKSKRVWRRTVAEYLAYRRPSDEKSPAIAKGHFSNRGRGKWPQLLTERPPVSIQGEQACVSDC